MFLGLTNPLRLTCSTVQRVRQILNIIPNFIFTKITKINFYLPLLSNRVNFSPTLFLRMLSRAGWVAGLQLATCPGPAAAPATTESVTRA